MTREVDRMDIHEREESTRDTLIAHVADSNLPGDSKSAVISALYENGDLRQGWRDCQELWKAESHRRRGASPPERRVWTFRDDEGTLHAIDNLSDAIEVRSQGIEVDEWVPNA